MTRRRCALKGRRYLKFGAAGAAAAGWLAASALPFAMPGWMNLWFAVYPTVQSLGAQCLAALVVIGSFFVSERAAQVRRAQITPVRAQ